MLDLLKKAYVTQFLIAINILIFIIEMMMGGESGWRYGAVLGGLYLPSLFQDGEWYRIFTAMFLHFGAEHLGSNMLSLIALGPFVERIMGHGAYLIIYVLSGLGGNLLTILIDLASSSYTLSAGASGAICGLLGAVLLFSVVKRFRRLFPFRNAILAFFFMLAPGITDSSINLWAHLGGAVSGFIVTGIIYIFKVNLSKKQQTV